MRELPASQGCDLASAAGVEYGQGHPVNTPPRPRGFAIVKIERIGLVVADVAVHEKNRSRWASLPAKAMLDRTGAVLRDDAGKIKYVAVVQWGDRATADRFSHAVVTELLARHPEPFAVEQS
jgi:hypothetical protein